MSDEYELVSNEWDEPVLVLSATMQRPTREIAPSAMRTLARHSVEIRENPELERWYRKEDP